MTQTGTITVIGLGTGDPRRLTVEACDFLDNVNTLHVDTGGYFDYKPLQARFPHLDIRLLDHVHEASSTPQEAHGRITAEILDRAGDENVALGVPGSAAISERIVSLLVTLGRARGLTVEIVPGLGYVEAVSSAAELFESPRLTILDALEIRTQVLANALGETPDELHHLAIQTPVTTAPVIIPHVYSTEVAKHVAQWLPRFWPADHPLTLVFDAGTRNERVERVDIDSLAAIPIEGIVSVVVAGLNPTEDVRTFAGLLNVTRSLRAPGGCPWDREQTHDTLKTHLIEETYEVVEALDRHDYLALSEELGDLMFQITIHSQIANEHREFTIEDVLAGISGKLVRRHPHVFGDLNLPTSAAVLARWESLKQQEKPERESILSSIPEAMPALPYSYAVQKRVANQGFDWETVDDVLNKVDEELAELRASLNDEEGRTRVLEELGDLLFVIVSVGRRLKIDPEEALRKANRKFVERFKHVERAVKRSGKAMTDYSSSELDGFWQKAKSDSAT